MSMISRGFTDRRKPMKRSFLIPLLLGALAAWCGSCIENNLPYPVVEIAIEAIEAAFWSAKRLTFVGSTMPASIMLTYCSL